MALRINRNKKEVSSKIKEKQKNISDAINLEEKRLEEIKGLEESTELVTAEQQEIAFEKESEIEKLNEEVKEKKEELADIDTDIEEKKIELNEKTKQIGVIQKEIDGTVEKAKEENKKTIDSKNTVIKQMNEEKGVLQYSITKLEEEKKELFIGISNINATYTFGKNALKDIEDKIKDREKKLSILVVDFERLSKEKTDIEFVKKDEIKLRKSVVLLEKTIKEAEKEIIHIDEIKSKKTKDLDEREEKIKRRGEAIKHREDFIENRAKDIEQKARTLQKHFDKHKIPIKVM